MVMCTTSFAYLSNELRNMFGVINLLIGLAAFTGNLLAILVILKTNYFWNRSTCFLASLMLTDFFIGAIIEPMHFAQLFSQELRNNCKFNNVRRYVTTVLIGGSVYSIGLVSFDRYTRLSRQQNYTRYMHKAKVTVLIVLSWVLALIVPVLMKISKDEQVYSGIVFGNTIMIFIFMAICYLLIVKIVKEKKRLLNQHELQNGTREGHTRTDIRAAKASVLLIMCFCLTMFPLSIYHCMVAVKALVPHSIPGFKELTRDTFYTVGVTIAMAGSAINPLIYYFRSPTFKENLLQMLNAKCSAIGCPRERRRVASSGNLELEII